MKRSYGNAMSWSNRPPAGRAKAGSAWNCAGPYLMESPNRRRCGPSLPSMASWTVPCASLLVPPKCSKRRWRSSSVPAR
eukprot:g17459.t1